MWFLIRVMIPHMEIGHSRCILMVYYCSTHWSCWRAHCLHIWPDDPWLLFLSTHFQSLLSFFSQHQDTNHCRTHNLRVCLYIAYIACGSASLYIKTLYFLICTFFMLAAATVANIEIRYDAKTPQFAIFGTRVICVFYSIYVDDRILFLSICVVMRLDISRHCTFVEVWALPEEGTKDPLMNSRDTCLVVRLVYSVVSLTKP